MIGSNIFPTGIMKTVGQEIHISRLELQRWPLEFVISFFKEHTWDLELRFGFWDLKSQISIRRVNFQFIFSKLTR
jgi:hypothetical protein